MLYKYILNIWPIVKMITFQVSGTKRYSCIWSLLNLKMLWKALTFFFLIFPEEIKRDCICNVLNSQIHDSWDE